MILQRIKNFVLRTTERKKALKKGHLYGKVLDFGASYQSASAGYRLGVHTLMNIYQNQSDIATCIDKWQAKVGQRGYRYVNVKNPDQPISDFERKELDGIFNHFSPWMSLRNRIVRDLGISGNCFVHIVRSVLGKAIIGLMPLDFRTMRVVATSSGEIVKYIQRVSNKDPVEFEPHEIIHFKLNTSTYNECYGMSPMEKMIWEARTDMAAMFSNYFFFENDATPGAIYILDEGLSLEEIEVAKELIRENFKGVKNKHKAMVMAGIKEVKELNVSAKDMEFYDGRNFSTSKICSAYGVPKFMLGYTESVNNNNGLELTKNAYLDTFEPLEQLIDTTFNRQFFNRCAGLAGRIEMKHNKAVFDEKEREERALNELKFGVITPRQYKIKTGQEVTPEDEANPMFDTHVIHSGASAVILSEVGIDPVVDPNDPEAAENMIKALKNYAQYHELRT